MKRGVKRILILFWIFVILGLCAVLWRTAQFRQKTASVPGPSVVASGYVPYTLARQLLGEHGSLSMLLPAGAEPHSFEPTPFALVQLQQADSFIYMSPQLEPWAADLAKSAGPNTHILPLAALVPAAADPHVWMNFKNAQLMAYQLASLLSQIDPQYRDEIDQNYLTLARELDELDTEFKNTLSNCRYNEVVHIGHLAFENLLVPYGIKLTALAGTSHEGEQSAKKVAELVRQIKEKQIPAVFTEETLSPRLAQTIAAETGAEILYLYPIEHISKRDFASHVTYQELMRRNLESLKRGLQCPVS